MSRKDFPGRSHRGCCLAILLAAVLVAPGAGLGRFENRGTAAGAEPVPAAETPAAEKPAAERAEPATAVKKKNALRVVDEQGNPVNEFEIKVWTAPLESSQWLFGSEGQIAQSQPAWGYGKAKAIDLTVRADGFASILQHFAGPELEKLKAGEATVVMHPGQEVRVAFRLPPGVTWPNGIKPEIYFDGMKNNVRRTWQPPIRSGFIAGRGLPDFNMLNFDFEQPAAATIRLTAETAPFRVAIHSPGFLQFFERGPFTLADVKEGKLEIDVDRPATLDMRFDPGSTEAEKLPFESAEILVLWKMPDTASSYYVAATSAGTEPRQQLQLADLSAGDYRLGVRTKARPGVENLPGTGQAPINPGAFFAEKKVSLAAGQTERIDFPYTPFDPKAFRGDRTAVLHILKSDESPAVGRAVTVMYFDGHYGALEAFSGTVPDSGILTLSGITDRKSEVQAKPYTVVAGDQSLGRFGFAGDPTTGEFTFHVPPGVGDIAPNIELVNVATGATARLSDFRGKVVCLEFWATWCGPCQGPMAKMNQLVVDKRDAWKDRATIVPVSIDDATDEVKQHVASRGWTNLEYYWTGNDGVGGWESPAPKAFAVDGVPTSLIIDAEGRIVWRGHPSDVSDGLDLEGRIAAAIKP